jgi:hypothetical protein
MLVSKECWERGCSCYDDRVDKDPVEVVKREWVGLTAKDLAEIPPSAYEGAIWADAKLKEKNT